MVITISREYGAGGRSVAKALSQRLGLEYHDIDFVKMTAKITGYSEEDIRRESEDMSGSTKFINAILNGTAAYKSSYDEIYKAQEKIVLELAKKPCIIVGRCSNIILRQAQIPSFDIFLYADKSFRLIRAAELAENGTEDIEKFVEKRDQWRNNYHKAYTSHDMGYYKDYHICLDVGTIGLNRCVDILVEILEGKEA